MEKRYRALRIISTLYRILGVIVLIVAIISAIGLCLTAVMGGSALQQLSKDLPQEAAGVGLLGSAIFGIAIGIGSFIGGGLTGLSLYAMGEGISLAITMEENTRATAMYLSAQHRAAAPVHTPQ